MPTTWQWSYPYNATDTGTVLFNASPADATYQWRLPLKDVPVPRQVTIRTTNGQDRVYTVGAAGRLIVLRFDALAAGSAGTPTALYGYLGILEFFLTHTDYGKRPFGFYDHAGASEVQVRFTGDGPLAFEEIENSLRRGEIRLEKVIA